MDTLPTDREAADPQFLARLVQIERMVVLLDCRYRIPWTRVWFGIDPVVSLVPVAGDLVMAVVSMRIVMIARSLGVGRLVLVRMILNVVFDLLLGIVPLLGPLMDIFFRANLSNFNLLLKEIERASKKPAG